MRMDVWIEGRETPVGVLTRAEDKTLSSPMRRGRQTVGKSRSRFRCGPSHMGMQTGAEGILPICCSRGRSSTGALQLQG